MEEASQLGGVDETEKERLSNHINYMMELIEEMETTAKHKQGEGRKVLLVI